MHYVGHVHAFGKPRRYCVRTKDSAVLFTVLRPAIFCRCRHAYSHDLYLHGMHVLLEQHDSHALLQHLVPVLKRLGHELVLEDTIHHRYPPQDGISPTHVQDQSQRYFVDVVTNFLMTLSAWNAFTTRSTCSSATAYDGVHQGLPLRPASHPYDAGSQRALLPGAVRHQSGALKPEVVPSVRVPWHSDATSPRTSSTSVAPSCNKTSRRRASPTSR